jgi:hypothetical protein
VGPLLQWGIGILTAFNARNKKRGIEIIEGELFEVRFFCQKWFGGIIL